MTGIVGGKWTFDNFSPSEIIPVAVNLTVYGGGPEEFIATPLNKFIKQIVDRTMVVPIGRTFSLDQIVEAHQTMDNNTAGGKIVVLT